MVHSASLSSSAFYLHRKIEDFPHSNKKDSDQNLRFSYIVPETNFTPSTTADSGTLSIKLMLEVPSIRKRTVFHPVVIVIVMVASAALLLLSHVTSLYFSNYDESYGQPVTVTLIIIFVFYNAIGWVIPSDFVENRTISYMEDRIWVQLGKKSTYFKVNKLDRIKVELNSYEGQKHSITGTSKQHGDGTQNFLTLIYGDQSRKFEFFIKSWDTIQVLKRQLVKYEKSTKLSVYDSG